MLSNNYLDFLTRMEKAATDAGHIFPAMAAAEAALESGFGTSRLSILDHNHFGTKQHAKPIYDTVALKTKEFLHGKWVDMVAEWVVYPNDAACFTDRIDTLHRMAPKYPNYAAALAAKDAYQYIAMVSKTWSTDPQRAIKVVKIYRDYQDSKGGAA